MPMNSAKHIWNLNISGYPLVWVASHEPERVILEINSTRVTPEARVFAWNCVTGLSRLSDDNNQDTIPDTKDCKAAFAAVTQYDGLSVYIFVLAYPYLNPIQMPTVIQSLRNILPNCKSENKTVVIVSPDEANIPVELSRDAFLVEYGYPDTDCLKTMTTSIIDETMAVSNEFEPPSDDTIDAAVEAMTGLTLGEAENAMAYSFTIHRKLDPEDIWDAKRQVINKSGILSISKHNIRWQDVGGLKAIKAFIEIIHKTKDFNGKGLLMTGIPGVGKTLCAKAMSDLTGLPTIIFDLSRCFGGIVGQTESNVRHAINTIEAVGKSIVMIDEIEKAVAGGTGHSGDSGTTQRAFGKLLTWLNDQDTAFIMATANHVDMLPAEFTRAGRWDAMFFFDLPSAQEREAIWKIHRRAFGVPETAQQPNDANWTGAEIMNCCRLSQLHRDEGSKCLLRSAQYVVPIFNTQAEYLAEIRKWADNRCLNASEPGRYQLVGAQDAGTKTRRLR